MFEFSSWDSECWYGGSVVSMGVGSSGCESSMGKGSMFGGGELEGGSGGVGSVCFSGVGKGRFACF